MGNGPMPLTLLAFYARRSNDVRPCRDFRRDLSSELTGIRSRARRGDQRASREGRGNHVLFVCKAIPRQCFASIVGHELFQDGRCEVGEWGSGSKKCRRRDQAGAGSVPEVQDETRAL
jgi:hypothetical protein